MPPTRLRTQGCASNAIDDRLSCSSVFAGHNLQHEALNVKRDELLTQAEICINCTGPRDSSMDLAPAVSTLLVRTHSSNPIPSPSKLSETLDSFLKEAYQIVS
jgi:hypothetical protein